MNILKDLGISPIPWTIAEIDDGEIRSPCEDGHTKVVARCNTHFKERTSDARLMSSAPDLLVSVIDLLGIIGNIGELLGVDCGDIDKIHKAKEAVAKATGNKPLDIP